MKMLLFGQSGEHHVPVAVSPPKSVHPPAAGTFFGGEISRPLHRETTELNSQEITFWDPNHACAEGGFYQGGRGDGLEFFAVWRAKLPVSRLRESRLAGRLALQLKSASSRGLPPAVPRTTPRKLLLGTAVPSDFNARQ